MENRQNTPPVGEKKWSPSSEVAMQELAHSIGKAIVRVRVEVFDAQAMDWRQLRGQGLIIHGKPKQLWKLVYDLQSFIKQWIREEVQRGFTNG